MSALHRLHIRGWTMLPLTLISIKPFLWNSVPHRSQLPTCLFSISRWCRILAERAASENTRSGLFKVCLRACVCLCVTLLDIRPLKSRWSKSREQSCFIIQPTSFGFFLIDWFKNVFPMLCHCLQAVKGEPPVNNSNLIGKKSIHGTSLASRITVP